MIKLFKGKSHKTKPKKSKFKAVVLHGNNSTNTVNLDISENTFRYRGRQYNIFFEDVMLFKVDKLFSKVYYIFYVLENPDPLSIQEDNIKPKFLSATEYDTILESKVIEKTNEHSRGNKFLEDLLTPMNIGIVIVIGVIAWYIMGGS